MNHIAKRVSGWLASLLLVIALPACAAEEAPSADTAWRELQKASNPPAPPREWSSQRPSDEELSKFNRERAGKALAAADQAKAFQTGFPDDKRAGEARLLEYNLLTAVVQLGDASVTERMKALRQQLVADPAIDAEERLGLVLMAARDALQGAGSGDPVAGLLQARTHFEQAFEMFPKRAEPAAYLLQLSEMLLAYDQVEPAREVVAKLLKADLDEDIRKEAAGQLAKFERVGKPVEITFTALDGRKIDLAKMKGQVVLIDFWATWCGPCIAGLPELKEVYAKWQPKGFEILGISLDDDEEALATMVKEKDMPWPQFFDRENASNRYAEQYGITGIPTLWLIDKQGNLRYLNARQNMEAKVAKLMAE